jgi:two-component system chemotaxis response regulator CheV
MEQQTDKNEIYEDELIRLVSSNSDTSNQYVIFRNITDDLFAINVAKVEELIQNKNLTISKSLEKTNIISGVAKIRGNMVTLVDFDKWINQDIISSEETHDLIILCYYSNKRMGLIIKNVVGIHSIDSINMSPSSDADTKTAFIAELNLGKKVLCNIFDSDKLITDVYPSILNISEGIIQNLDNQDMVTNKLILVAEDSKLIQIPIAKLLNKLGYTFEIYENGQLLLDRLYELDSNSIGLIISDIEMPIMDGMEMITQIHNNIDYNQIPIIVNTNMSNAGIVKQAHELGVLEVVKKLNINALDDIIRKYCRD